VAVPAHGTSDLVGTLLVRLLFVKIGLGVRVRVNIGWIIDKSWRIRII
jgi:hypothetical protein